MVASQMTRLMLLRVVQNIIDKGDAVFIFLIYSAKSKALSKLVVFGTFSLWKSCGFTREQRFCVKTVDRKNFRRVPSGDSILRATQ